MICPAWCAALSKAVAFSGSSVAILFLMSPGLDFPLDINLDVAPIAVANNRRIADTTASNPKKLRQKERVMKSIVFRMAARVVC